MIHLSNTSKFHKLVTHFLQKSKKAFRRGNQGAADFRVNPHEIPSSVLLSLFTPLALTDRLCGGETSLEHLSPALCSIFTWVFMPKKNKLKSAALRNTYRRLVKHSWCINSSVWLWKCYYAVLTDISTASPSCLLWLRLSVFPAWVSSTGSRSSCFLPH